MGVGIDRHAFRFRSDNQIVLWEALKAGNGIGFGQAALVAREPLLEAILPALRLPVLPMWLAMHRDVRTSARIRRVADFLHDELKAYSAG
jgi:DNA-binding transcriptional LysR family regulator